MTGLKNATFYIFALAAICIVGIIVLIGLNKDVPTELWFVTVSLLSGGLGIAVPTSGDKPVEPSTVPPGSAG